MSTDPKRWVAGHVAALPNEHTAVKTWAIIVGVVSSVMCALFCRSDSGSML